MTSWPPSTSTFVVFRNQRPSDETKRNKESQRDLHIHGRLYGLSLTVITMPLQPARLARSPAISSRFGPNNPGAAPPASRHIMESCPRWWIV